MSINPSTPSLKISDFPAPPPKIRRTNTESLNGTDQESSENALDTFCPVRTIQASASSSASSSSSRQRSSSTSTKRTRTFDFGKSSSHFLRRILMLKEIFKDTDHSIFKTENKVYVGTTQISEDQQGGYLVIETTKEAVIKIFNENINQNKNSSNNNYNSITHYFSNSYFFKISLRNLLTETVLMIIPIPKKLIPLSVESSSFSHFCLDPENRKKFLGTVSNFFHFFAETVRGAELSPEQTKSLMEGQGRTLVPVVTLTTLQASEISAPNRSSFGSFVDYAVWKTYNTQDCIEDRAGATSKFIPVSLDVRMQKILAHKDVKKIFNAFIKENYYRDTPIEVAKIAPRTKRSAPSSSCFSDTSSNSILSETSREISTDTSEITPVGTSDEMHCLIGSYLGEPSLETPKIESNRAAAEALISLSSE